MVLIWLILLNTNVIFAKPQYSSSSYLDALEFENLYSGDSKIENCTLPAFPKNGRYVNVDPITSKTNPGAQPGANLDSYELKFICDAGYHHTRNKTARCVVGDVLDSEEFAQSECLPKCSCGISMIQSGVDNRCVDSDGFYAPTQKKVSGGRSAAKDELPWHVGIYSKKQQPYKQICGGTVVSHTVVISAAHCFWNDLEKKLPASNYAVASGKIYRPWNARGEYEAQRSDVAEIRIPPRFQGEITNYQDDIALVILAYPLKFSDSVYPVCLDFNGPFNDNQLKPGALGKVAGWGLTSEDGTESQVLKVAEIPVVAIEMCISTSDPTFKKGITSDKICAGYNNGTAVCKGDSGGGLIFPERVAGYHRFYLRGIVSAAPTSDHLCNTKAWATFTQVVNHQRFIQQTIPEILSRFASCS